jgi:3-deoxy-D-manno-octulosonic-acid transferase
MDLYQGITKSMVFLYTVLSFVLGMLLLPLLPCIVCRQKYRNRVLQRLGFGLAGQLAALPPRPASAPTLWLHALSVGEVTSALPLVRGIREAFPEARIVFSATTSSGAQVAHQLLAPFVDALISGPLDLGPVVPFFIKIIKPSLFILVETDFWPHWVHCLQRNGISTLLVNGRISQQSFVQYQRFEFLCRPMFRSFTLLSMQTASDAEKMAALGIETDRIITLGNLKFDTSQTLASQTTDTPNGPAKEFYGLNATAPLWICGSTHRGEEQLIFQIYQQLRRTIPALQLLVAPRNIERADEILALGHTCGLDCRKWTEGKHSQGPLLILDTIGELAGCYAMADTVFIGGSLVPQGGHNPIEPACAGVPVLFGPHMEDFAEIAAALVQNGGARQVASAESLLATLQQLFADPGLRRSMAGAARDCVTAHQGVVRKHLEIITSLLSPNTSGG